MMKFVLVLCVAAALIMPMHEIQAFKIITIQKGAYAAPAAAPASAAPAFDASALVQGVQSAVAAKLQQVQSLVGSIIQQKIALKQNVLNSIQSTSSSVKSQVQGSVSTPFVIRKSVYIGAAPKPSAASPEATTHIDVGATTTTN